MSQEKQHINYSAADIKKYLAGELSPAQMHAMEMAALNDPFLAEAMEGYESVDPKQWQSALSELQHKFNKTEQAKVVAMHPARRQWWKAAAAILVIGAGATLTYLLTNKNNPDPAKPAIAEVSTTAKDSTQIAANTNTGVLSENDKKEKPGAPAAVVTPAGPAASKEEVADKAVVRDSVSSSLAAATPAKGDMAAADEKRSAEQIQNFGNETNYYNRQANRSLPAPAQTNNANYNNVFTPNPKQAKDNSNNGYRKNDGMMANADREVTKPGTKPLSFNKNFMAQVVGPDNTPLPFSNISVRADNLETYADVKGNFRLVSTDSVLLVDVKSVGYQPKTVTLRGDQPLNRIQLTEENIAEADKKVIGIGRNNAAGGAIASRRAILLKDSVVNVEPADGWDNYNTYIANNIELPDDILKNNVHGQINVSFDVDASGNISNIKIDPSKCTNCEALTRKLIEQGPQWKNNKGKATSARFSVQF